MSLPRRDQETGGAFTPLGYNIDLELALIGAVMYYGPTALDRAGALSVDDFSPTNGHVWQTVAGYARQGITPTLPLVANDTALIRLVGDKAALNALLVDAYASGTIESNIDGHAKALAAHGRNRRLQAAALQLAAQAHTGDTDELIERINALRAPTPARLRLTPAEDVTLDRPHWVWDQRIPVGGVTLMVGREGDGKTLLVCWLAARISRGQLAGERHQRPADVLYVGMEDDRSTVIKPRLIAAGADLTRFQFVDLDGDRSFALDTDLADLAAAAATRDVGLVVFDPLDAHLGAVDSHRKADVQSVIGRLAALTQQLRCGALGLAHFNKAGLNDLLVRINGSRGFSTAVRSVLAVGAHPDNEADRLCVLAKANMTSKTDVPAIRFHLEGCTIAHPSDGAEISTARIVLLGEETGHHPDSLLQLATSEDRTLADEATEWLSAILADGPMPKADLVKLAHHEGLSDKALRIARERLHVITERDHTTQGRPSQWRLPP